MTNILLQNGLIVDGSGSPAYRGSLLMEGHQIRGVYAKGEELPQAEQQVDVNGLVIAPGFIDMHSHADWAMPDSAHAKVLKCLVEQGITTVVGGNCGISPAPIVPEVVVTLEALAAIAMINPLNYDWRSMGEFLERIENTRPLLNLAEQVGHATVRYVNGSTKRGTMTSGEQKKCKDAIRQSFEEGACGLSFGLGYDPGMYSSIEELEAFCAVAAECDKPVTVHLKALSRISPCYPLTTPRAHNELALEEMLGIARRTGIRLQLSHFIFVGRRSWSTAERCIEMVEKARADGVDVMIDAFPYTCGNTTIMAPFPYWFLENLPESYNRLSSRLRLRLEMGIGLRLVGFVYKDFQVMDAAVPGWEKLNGLRITDVARLWNCSPFNAMVKLAEKSKGATLMLFHSYSGEDSDESVLERVLTHDLCLFETDVAIKKTGYPNPAGLGTFPRILGRYVREKKLLSLENAINRMTLASAERFSLKGIGKLEAGYSADIVMFNADTIADTPPDNGQPAGKPKGVETVYINGTLVVEKGDYVTGLQPGRVLKP
jgi:N-acyl-D-amino-acid deacylase